jgi:hypothetical protein
MVTPKLTGYPVDRTVIRRAQLERAARHHRKQATRQRRWWQELFGAPDR